jgi:hypothetical protein
MERICDAAFSGKGNCFKACASLADEIYWGVVKLIPFKKGTAFFIISWVNENTCSSPDILNEYHCVSPQCTNKNSEKPKAISFNKPKLLVPTNAITAGEIGHGGIFISFRTQNQLAKQDVWGKKKFVAPQVGETCFQPKYENAYHNPEVARRCIHNASVRRIPQCYKVRYKNPKNSPEIPEYTIVRLIPAGPTSCYFYEYSPSEDLCPNLKDMRCLHGPSENCSQFDKSSAA